MSDKIQVTADGNGGVLLAMPNGINTYTFFHPWILRRFIEELEDAFLALEDGQEDDDDCNCGWEDC